MLEKVDFIIVNITQILVNIQKKFMDIVRIFYKRNSVNISSYRMRKAFFYIPPVNILYTNVEIKTRNKHYGASLTIIN